MEFTVGNEYKFSDVIGEVEKLVGKTIKFTAIDEYCEADFDEGMVAKVESYGISGLTDDEVLEIHLNFGLYEEYNNKLMQPVFYDKDGSPRLKWNETNKYNGKDTFYLMIPKKYRNEEIDNLNRFEVVDENEYK